MGLDFLTYSALKDGFDGVTSVTGVTGVCYCWVGIFGLVCLLSVSLVFSGFVIGLTYCYLGGRVAGGFY